MKLWNWLKSLRVEIYHTKSKKLLPQFPTFYTYTVICKNGHILKIPYIAGKWPSGEPYKEFTFPCGKCGEPLIIKTIDIYKSTQKGCENDKL